MEGWYARRTLSIILKFLLISQLCIITIVVHLLVLMRWVLGCPSKTSKSVSNYFQLLYNLNSLHIIRLGNLFFSNPMHVYYVSFLFLRPLSSSIFVVCFSFVSSLVVSFSKNSLIQCFVIASKFGQVQSINSLQLMVMHV